MILEPLLPLLIRMALPTMTGMMVSVIYSITDILWIGRLNDTGMTAAIGITFSFVSLVQALGFWYGYGSGNVMSRVLGAKDDAEAEIISGDGIALSIGSGLVLALIGYPLARPLSVYIGGNISPQILGYTTDYLKIMVMALPFSLFSITVYNQFRLCGNGKDAMIGLTIGMLVNMILDPIFILGLQMSIAGAGWATLTGQAASCVYFFVFSRRHGNIPVSLLHVSFRNRRLYHILAGGAPNFTRQGITSFALLAVNQQAAAGYGDTVVAALTVSSRAASIGYMLMIGFAQGFQPICAMNFGAHQYDRVKKAFRLTVKMGTGFMVISAILLTAFARQLTGLLSADPQVIELSVLILRLQCISFPFLGFYAVSSMYMQNVGEYAGSLLISVSRQGIFYLPLLFLLPLVFGEMGLYLLQPAADIISVGLAVFVIRQYRFPDA